MSKKIRAALIGFGSMGHFHASCYAKQKNVELVAICDIDPAKFQEDEAEINLGKSGKSAFKGVIFCTSYQELKRKADFEMLDICLPGYLHSRYAEKALSDGYHVLCEKPMAGRTTQADRMIKSAEKNGKKLMIAQCLRFAPAFNQLKKFYESNEFGKLLRLDMRRNSYMPKQEWYHDSKKSGGALLDLHLHDSDFINYMLGRPDAVQTCGITRESGGLDDLLTLYTYNNGPLVSAEGSWCRGHWHCEINAIFERASVELCDFTTITVYEKNKPERKIEFKENTNPFFNEIAYFADCIINNHAPEQCLPASTRQTIEIVAAEERSARSRRKVSL